MPDFKSPFFPMLTIESMIVYSSSFIQPAMTLYREKCFKFPLLCFHKKERIPKRYQLEGLFSC